MDNAVDSDKPYTYQVTAVTDKGVESARSIEATATPKAKGPPTTVIEPGNTTTINQNNSTNIINNTTNNTVFVDVLNNAWYTTYITELVSINVISGYNDGTFKPDEDITRAEFAKMICLATGWDAKATRMSFRDVTQGHRACTYIESAKAHGVITGYPDRTFKPNNSATRAEVSKIIALAIN
ncbi:MAG TPA: S-layer homology domain-containing protein [Candidatus Aquicultor sp.]